MVEKTNEIIGNENITEYIEPSAGKGVFLDYLDKPYMAYDIIPEDSRIIKQDYLTLKIKFKRGRCIIGNPPFGRSMNLATQFYKKSIRIGDYISFILPISQYKNNIKLYEFDLLHSEDLKSRRYTDRNIHCCLNIFARPFTKKFNKKPNYKLRDVDIFESNSRKKITGNFDIRIKSWGASKTSRIGHEVEYPNQYAQEFCIRIHNTKYKEEILALLRNTVWEDVYAMKANPTLVQWQVYKYLKEQVPGIK